MGGKSSIIPLHIQKEVLNDNGNYEYKILILRPYNPGHSGYSEFKYKCKYCQEIHDTVSCPYKWYYKEA